MIQRIQLLSISMTHIQQACKDLVVRRNAVLPKVIHQLIQQQHTIDTVRRDYSCPVDTNKFILLLLYKLSFFDMLCSF